MHTVSMAPILPADILYVAYVLVFATAAVTSVGAVRRARRIEHGGTRRGLVWLLLMSGGWATAHVAYLTMPTQGLQYTFYTVGLVIGWASVGPWLYFCSAYTGRSIVLSDVTQREEHQRELEDKNAKLEQFASIVSHDLRNPLQVAKGRTKLAIEDETVAHLDPVVRAHDRMEQLIEEILTLAREGNTIDETEAVDIAGLARQSWEMVDAESASLIVEDGFSATFDADPERLRQLFENLYRNAVEHGSNEVTITVGELNDGAGFYVADDGPGIPPEDRETVFEAGYTTNTEGTGFGLAIVSEIVDGHGWAISVTGGTDGGARFEIRTD